MGLRERGTGWEDRVCKASGMPGRTGWSVGKRRRRETPVAACRGGFAWGSWRGGRVVGAILPVLVTMFEGVS